jgi:FkbM family methyltransferase
MQMMDSLFRALPRFRGKYRLAGWLLPAGWQEARDVRVQGRHGCAYTLPNLRENVSLRIFLDGVYESETIRFMCERVPPGGTVLDLGFNLGSISIPMIRCRPDVRVVGIEASPSVFRYAERNIADNGLSGSIRLFQHAVCDVDDVSLPFEDRSDLFGQSSLVLQETPQTVSVPAIRIDTFLQRESVGRVDFIKVDIEGFEYQAFLGAAGLLSGPEAPDILFEFGDWAEERAGLKPGSAQKLLLSMGYVLYRVEGLRLHRMNEPVTWDFAMIFATKKLRVD